MPFLCCFQVKDEHFDGWELKNSILNTLFQAVKAITGGVTAIKGQLIKGSGYALSHGAKVKQCLEPRYRINPFLMLEICKIVPELIMTK